MRTPTASRGPGPRRPGRRVRSAGAIAAAYGAMLLACNPLLGLDELGSAPDASLGDAGGAEACDALLCEGFEQALSPPWGTDVEPPDAGFAAPDSIVAAHGGKQALHLHLDATDAGTAGNLVAQILRPVAFPAAFFVRVFLDVRAPGPENLVRLVALDDALGYPMFLVEQGGRLGLTEPDGTVGYAAQTFPLDRWVCVELSVSTVADGGLRTVRVFQDGLAIVDRQPATTTVPLDLLYLQTLFVDVPAQPAVDVLMDDLVVAPAPVGCAR